MSMALTLLQRGSFTSTGVAVKVDLPGGADYFVAENLTQIATTQNPGRGVKFEWWPSQADAAAIMWTKQNSSNAIDLEAITSGGFTYVTSYPEPEAPKTGGTAITAANQPEVTLNSHGFSDGDRVRLYGTTGMLQIAGMDFIVDAATTNTFELEGQDFSGFAAAATAVSARRLPALLQVEPGAHIITNVSQAASAVVRTSVSHGYVVGQVVYFSVPSGYGMTQLNGIKGEITAVTTFTFTVDIDTAGFTAFTMQASSASPVKFAMVGPEGQHNTYNVDEVPFRTGQFIPYMLLGAGADGPAGSNNDVIQWQAYKAENGS